MRRTPRQKKGKCPLGQTENPQWRKQKKGTRIPRKTLAGEEITPPIAHATEQNTPPAKTDNSWGDLLGLTTPLKSRGRTLSKKMETPRRATSPPQTSPGLQNRKRTTPVRESRGRPVSRAQKRRRAHPGPQKTEAHASISREKPGLAPCGGVECRPTWTASDYLISTLAPAASSFALICSASSLLAPVFTALGAPSTRSLASFRPRPVRARTSLITGIF